MSNVKTYLILVWGPDENEWWSPDIDKLSEDEREAVTEVQDLGIRVGEPIIELHIALPLQAPLTPEQMQGLAELKDGGWFSNFYVRDEISHESKPKSSNLNAFLSN